MSYTIVESKVFNAESAFDIFEFMGNEFDLNDFTPIVSPLVNSLPEITALGFTAIEPRGFGNADTAVYALDVSDYYDNDEIRIALLEYNA